MRYYLLFYIFLFLNNAVLFVSTCFSYSKTNDADDLLTTQEHLAASLVNISERTPIKKNSFKTKNDYWGKRNLTKQNQTSETIKNEVKHGINIEDKKFVETYLHDFGYLNDTKDSTIDGSHLIPALKAFQEYFQLLPANGKLDLRTTEQMFRKRCSVPDVYSKPLDFLWERSELRYFLVVPSHIHLKKWLPMNMELSDLKELIRQAFFAWKIVISMNFLEEAKSEANADIIFEVSERKNDQSELGVANGMPSLKSRIWLNRDEKWSTFQVQEEGKLDIFFVLIHEIGHILGLEHSHDKSSVMYPIFERDVGEQLPVINNDDIERLRMLYEPDEVHLHSDKVPQEKNVGTSNIS